MKKITLIVELTFSDYINEIDIPIIRNNVLTGLTNLANTNGIVPEHVDYHTKSICTHIPNISERSITVLL
jgi:hypothetical protein